MVILLLRVSVATSWSVLTKSSTNPVREQEASGERWKVYTQVKSRALDGCFSLIFAIAPPFIGCAGYLDCLLTLRRVVFPGCLRFVQLTSCAVSGSDVLCFFLRFKRNILFATFV